MFGRAARRAVKDILRAAPAPIRDRSSRTVLRAYERYLGAKKARTEVPLFDRGLPVPPPGLRATVVWHTDPAKFLDSGRRDNQMMRESLGRAGRAASELRVILDWGCGCGRLARWWSDIPEAEVRGCDYNRELVEWVDSNLPCVSGTPNELGPPLPYKSETFDFVYAISVFTHLDDDLAGTWLAEIRRVLKPGGFFFFTSHGAAYRDHLTGEEARRFDAGRSVVHFASIEGTNLCGSYWPRQWVQEFVARAGLELADVVEAHALGEEARASFPQDRYLVRKPQPVVS